jgi:hypothetical protein
MIKSALLLTLIFFSGCANVSIRNYDQNKLSSQERTLIGSFEVLNDDKPMPECKITFLLPDGKSTRRYFQQKQDQGIVLTWSDTGMIKIQGIDCGDGSFALSLKNENYAFKVSPEFKSTYFGHVKVIAQFSGISDSAGAGALGALGIALAGASRTQALKAVTIEDHWNQTKPIIQKLAPSLDTTTVQKSLAKKTL